MNNVSRFRTELPVDRPTAFEWHEREGAFERLTPPWEDVEVVRKEGGIENGTVELRLSRGPVKLTWKLRHLDFIRDERFVDEQVEGPFAHWRHEHRFEDAPEGRSIMHDEIEWKPPLGGAGDMVAVPIVEKDLERMFRFRHTRLVQDLEHHARYAGRPRLRVAITGASGLIGSQLSALLTTGGHTVVPMIRDRKRAEAVGGIYWNAERQEIDDEALRGVDAVVHLAGESIQALRWTEEKKRAILESRVKGTGLISRTMAQLRDGPDTLVCASAVGYYGNRKDEILDEYAGKGRGFLADVVEAWEGATGRAEGSGLRVVKVRLGLVLAGAGGALGTMLPAFKAGVGGRLGSGRQYAPWIDLDDAVGIFHHALMTPEVRGVLNATAPNPVPNATFTDALGRVLSRPTILPLPSLAVRAALGEMGVELLLHGQRARPVRTLESGYRFRFEAVEDSLRHQLGRASTAVVPARV